MQGAKEHKGKDDSENQICTYSLSLLHNIYILFILEFILYSIAVFREIYPKEI